MTSSSHHHRKNNALIGTSPPDAMVGAKDVQLKPARGPTRMAYDTTFGGLIIWIPPERSIPACSRSDFTDSIDYPAGLKSLSIPEAALPHPGNALSSHCSVMARSLSDGIREPFARNIQRIISPALASLLASTQ